MFYYHFLKILPTIEDIKSNFVKGSPNITEHKIIVQNGDVLDKTVASEIGKYFTLWYMQVAINIFIRI